MKLFRYRKPSVKTLLGITKAKKRAKKAVGITAVVKPVRAPKNIKRQALRKARYYSAPMKLLRHGLPSLLGRGRRKKK